jgi:hypothetical protein
MPTPQRILEQMDGILDQLIKTAEMMQRLSSQVVSEVEIIPLQKVQEELVSQLMALDEAFQTAYTKMGHTEISPIRQQIAAKLTKFQTLNSKFIENLKEGQKLLEVEAPAKNKKNRS